MTHLGRQTMARRWGTAAALVLTVGAVACDSLLEVDLPAAVTSDALDNPGVAGIRVNSVMALFECAYSTFSMDASGYEDNWQRVSGVAGDYSEYNNTPGGGTCDTGVYNQSYRDAFLIARGMGYENHGKLKGWGSSSQLIATNAFYTAAILDIWGEYFCENAIDGGPLLTNTQVLDLAEDWADTVLAYATTDFPITTTTGTHSSSIRTAAYGLRARIRWARHGAGDLAAAAVDAALVPTNHVSWVLREDGEKRRNMIASMQGNGGGTQAAGFLQGPVHIKGAVDPYGIDQLGNKPNGTPWPSPVPFTGYLNLAVETATGRLVDDSGNALTTAVAGTQADPRVTHALGTTAGGTDNIETKYKTLSDDIPLINWREMRLIQAQAAGPGATATALVNSIRPAGMPLIQGAYQTLVESDNDAFRNMIIEETRRALWLEGRFWSTKIQNTDKLWFPRSLGSWVNASVYRLGGGVRVLLDADEYQINQNFADAGGLALRGTGCAAAEAPVGF